MDGIGTILTYTKNIIKGRKTFLTFFPLIILTTTFFHNKYITLILIVIILSFFLLKKWKKYKKILLFFFISFVYLSFSYWNSKKFHSFHPSDFNFSIIKEVFYLLKYLIPLMFYLLIKKINDTNKNNNFIIKVWSLFIFLSLIITNLFKISYSSYSNEIIKGNIFDWFLGDYNYIELASRGFFTYGNQIALLISIFSAYFIFKKDYLFLFLNIFSGIIIATRISTFLPIMMLCLFVIYNFILEIYKKKLDKKYYLKFFIVILISIPFILFSPQWNRINKQTKPVKTKIENVVKIKKIEISKIEEKSNKNNNSNKNTVINKKEYVFNNYQKKNISEKFVLNYYPYQYDSEFWYNFMQERYKDRIDYRYLEHSIIKRIYEINDNYFNYFFGIGLSRIYSIWNLERDFLLQFYAFGIFGCLIIFYVYYLIARDIVKKNIINKNIECLYPLAILGLFILISMLSGNILNSLPVTMISIFTIYSLNQYYYID